MGIVFKGAGPSQAPCAQPGNLNTHSSLQGSMWDECFFFFFFFGGGGGALKQSLVLGLISNTFSSSLAPTPMLLGGSWALILQPLLTSLLISYLEDVGGL